MRNLVIYLILFLSTSVESKNYKVVDFKTKEPLAGVKINNTYSDFDGNIEVDSIKTYNYVSYKLIKIENDSIFLSNQYN